MSRIRPEKPVWAIKIKEVRQRLKDDQRTFGLRLRVTQSAVSHWEAATHRPNQEQWMSLARLAQGEPEHLLFLEEAGVPASYLMGEGGPGLVPTVVADDAVRRATEQRASDLVAKGYLQEHTRDTRHVPLLRDAAAAGSARTIDESEVDQLVALPKAWTGEDGTLYLVPVEGDSMAPVLESGARALVNVAHRNLRKLEQHMVLARVGDGVTIKWLRRDGDTYMLVPQHVSQRHPIQIIRPGSDIEVIGEVLLWIGHPPPARRTT